MTLVSINATSLIRFWNDLRAGGSLPLRDQLTPQSLQMWLGSLSINEFHRSTTGNRVFVSIQGEFVSRGMQDNFSGKYLDDCVPDSARDDAQRPYDMAAEFGQPVCSIIAPSESERDKARFVRVVLPLAEHDPEVTSYFLVFTETKGLGNRASGSVYTLWAGDDGSLFHTCDIIDV